MAVKLILTWDILPEKDQEYFEFVVREFIPGVQRLGFDLSDAWATVYGSRGAWTRPGAKDATTLAAV